MREYNAHHSGVAIVCGGGPTLHSDLERAQAMRPIATLLGVNFSATLVPEIRHVWTQHLEIVPKIKAQCPHVRVHCRPLAAQIRTVTDGGNEEAADYLWPELGWVAGSSGFAAALWAKHGMGFDEVILAGVPLNPETLMYDPGYREATMKGGRPPAHDEGRHFASPDSMEHWHQCIRNFTRDGKTYGIHSMSGWTAEWLGMPR